MKLPPFYDLVAAAVTLILLIAVIIYPLCGLEVPQFILLPFSTAMGWIFRSGVQIQNELRHRKVGVPNGPASTSGPPSGCPQ